MTNIIKDYYENNSWKCNCIQKWFMGWLFYKFERFNVDRNDKCVELVGKNLKNKEIKSICDIWCSRWLLLKKLIKVIPDLKYISWIDIDEKILEEAKSNVEWWDFYSCDINEEFQLHKKCDLITCLAVLEHVFDPGDVFKNISNNLNKGGYLIIQVPNIVCITRRIAFLFWNRPRTSRDAWWDWWHIAYFTKKDVVKLFESNWFKVEKITGSWVFASLRNWWVSLLSPDIICIWIKK